MPTQKQVIEDICRANPDAVIIGSIGSVCYDLTEIEHPNKILIRGAMGAALGCGLGYAMQTTKQVIVIIGDGSILMKMGSISTIIKHSLPNLTIMVMNNNCYRSCGGQSTNFKYIEHLVNACDSFYVYEVPSP